MALTVLITRGHGRPQTVEYLRQCGPGLGERTGTRRMHEVISSNTFQALGPNAAHVSRANRRPATAQVGWIGQHARMAAAFDTPVMIATNGGICKTSDRSRFVSLATSKSAVRSASADDCPTDVCVLDHMVKGGPDQLTTPFLQLPHDALVATIWSASPPAAISGSNSFVPMMSQRDHFSAVKSLKQGDFVHRDESLRRIANI